MMPRPLTPPATVFAWSGVRFEGAPASLFTLDAQLGDIVRSTRTPIIGQMRLTWWHDALAALGGSAPTPAHPVLRALVASVLPHGIAGGDMTPLVAGWEVLGEREAMNEAALAAYADGRGGTLYALLAVALGADPSPAIRAAGRCWALADLAANVTDPAFAGRAAEAAAAEASSATARPWSGLAHDARLAVAGRGAPGSPRRAVAVLATLIRRG